MHTMENNTLIDECRFGKLYFHRVLAIGDIRDSDVNGLIDYLVKHKGYKRFFHSE